MDWMILIAALAACGIFIVLPALWGLHRQPPGVWHVVFLTGEPGEAEQQIRAGRRHLPGRILFADCGLTPDGRETARILLRQCDQAILCTPGELTEMIEQEIGRIGRGTHQRHHSRSGI